MTQLLLFDTPATESFAPHHSANLLRSSTELMSTELVLPVAGATAESGSHSAETHQAGLNHMGDLARIVLRRYDLLAQRRAKRLATQATGR
jgi:hypothetical protein